jgi:hypothetical protein
MNAVEFATDLTASPTLAIPADAAARLPRSGRVRVLVLTDEDAEQPTVDDAELLRDDTAYEQGYARIPEDVSLTTAVLPHLATEAGDWERGAARCGGPTCPRP